MAPKRLVIYDLDGTLVDTAEDIVQAVNHAVTSLGHPALSGREIRAGVGSGVANLLGRCLKTDDKARIDAGVQLFREYYGAHLTDHSALYPGTRDVLEHFRGRTQAVLTNKPEPFAQDLVRALGIDGYFTQVIAADGRAPIKPDPSVIFALLKTHEVVPEAALMIGDSPIDIETGRRAGITTAIVSHGFSDEAQLRAARPDALVRDFPSLLPLATQRGW